MPEPLDTVRSLCAFARRAPCTDAERRAAGWLREELGRRGHEAWVEPVWIRPQWPLALLLHTALAVVASVVSVSAPAVGLGIAVAVVLSLLAEASGRTSPLRLPFRRRATQVVVTEPEDPDVIELILCAGYDAPRRGLVFRDAFRRLAARGRGPGPLGWLIAATLAVAAAAGARLAGLDAAWLGAIQFLPTVALLLAFAAVADIALSDVSPGASDPASGAAVALAAHDELVARPPGELSVSLLLAGAGESVPPAVVRAHLKREQLAPEEVVVLEIGACGSGEPVLATRHPQLRRAATAAQLPLAPVRRPTAMRAARSLRLPTARLACLEEGITPRSRQPSDTPEAVDGGAMEGAYEAALELIDALDDELAERRRAREAELRQANASLAGDAR